MTALSKQKRPSNPLDFFLNFAQSGQHLLLGIRKFIIADAAIRPLCCCMPPCVRNELQLCGRLLLCSFLAQSQQREVLRQAEGAVLDSLRLGRSHPR